MSVKVIQSKFILTLGGILFLLGAVLCFVKTIDTTLHAMNVRAWNKTPCNIEKISYEHQSYIVSKMKRYGRTEKYKINVLFSYEYDGKKYTSDCLRIMERTYAFEANAQKEVEYYRTLPAVECFVNPSNPEEAVLDPEISFDVFSISIIMCIIFLVAGVALLMSRRLVKPKNDHYFERWRNS